MNKTKIISNIKIFVFFIYVLSFYIYGGNSETVKYTEIILIIFLAFEFIRIIKLKKLKYSVAIIIIFAFTIYCFLSNFWAINQSSAIVRAKTLFLLSTFLLVTYNFFGDMADGEQKILKIIMYAGIIFSIYVILYYGVGEYFNKLLNGERIGKEINNVNQIGLQTSISFIIAVFYALYINQKRYVVLSILPLIVALGSGSRKVIILIVVGVILLFLLKREEKFNFIRTTKQIIFFSLIIFAFVCIAQSPMFSRTLERLEGVFNSFTGEGDIDESTIERKLFIRAGMQQFYKTPILGIGAGNSGYITLKVSGWATYLHNNFVELLATTGIIGFSLYYFVYGYIIYYCIKFLKKRNKFINITLIIFLVNLILEYGVVSYYSKTTYIYILLGLITIEKMKREDKLEKDNKIFKKT